MMWSRRAGWGWPRSAGGRWVPVLSLAAVGALAVALVVPLDGAAGEDLSGLELLSESAALAVARESGQETVADALTTSNLLVTALPSGQMRAQVSLFPVRVKGDDGGWAPVDNTLVERADGSVGPLRPAVPMSFSGGGDDPLAQISDGGRSLGMSWPRGDLPAPELVGTTANYRSVLPGVDLVAKASPVGYSTYVVVHSAQAARHPAVQQLAFDLDSDGVQVGSAPGGGLAATDGAETVFTAAAPVGWDATGVGESAASATKPAGGLGGAREDVGRALERAAAVGKALDAVEQAVRAPLSARSKAGAVAMPMTVSDSRVTLDATALLNDPATVFPAVLDPSVTRGDFKWAMVWSNGIEFYK